MTTKTIEQDDERAQQVMIYVLGRLNVLCRKRVVERGNGAVYLSAKGMAEYRELKASGFKPTDAEIAEMVEAISGPENRADVTKILIDDRG